MEYKSNSVDAIGGALVDFDLCSALRYYCHYQLMLHDKTVPLNQKEYYRQLWITECEKLADMVGGFTCEEYLDMHYRSSKLSPKR